MSFVFLRCSLPLSPRSLPFIMLIQFQKHAFFSTFKYLCTFKYIHYTVYRDIWPCSTQFCFNSVEFSFEILLFTGGRQRRRRGGKNASEYRKIIDSISNPYPFLGLKKYYYSILSLNVFQVGVHWRWFHRAATVDFWRTSHHDRKISTGGCTPTPFHYIYHHVQSSQRIAPTERADTLTLFHLYPYIYSVVCKKTNVFANICHSLFDSYWNSKKV